MSSFETTGDDETWSAWLRDAGVDDVYYSAAYARIWAREERADFIVVRYESAEGCVLDPLLPVPLDSLPGRRPFRGAHTLRFRRPVGAGRRSPGDPSQVSRCLYRFQSRDVICEHSEFKALLDVAERT